jgi:hypothetical protein
LNQDLSKLVAAVKSPLTFCTVSILIIESILGYIALHAQGTDFTILLCGMLGSFIFMIVVGAHIWNSQSASFKKLNERGSQMSELLRLKDELAQVKEERGKFQQFFNAIEPRLPNPDSGKKKILEIQCASEIFLAYEMKLHYISETQRKIIDYLLEFVPNQELFLPAVREGVEKSYGIKIQEDEFYYRMNQLYLLGFIETMLLTDEQAALGNITVMANNSIKIKKQFRFVKLPNKLATSKHRKLPLDYRE